MEHRILILDFTFQRLVRSRGSCTREKYPSMKSRVNTHVYVIWKPVARSRMYILASPGKLQTDTPDSTLHPRTLTCRRCDAPILSNIFSYNAVQRPHRHAAHLNVGPAEFGHGTTPDGQINRTCIAACANPPGTNEDGIC
jgi:hypothetical protein